MKIFHRETIQCERQPGKLRISSHACGLRYLEAQKMNREIPSDEFAMTRRLGLKICRTCPEGRKNALAVFPQTFSKKKGAKGTVRPKNTPKHKGRNRSKVF